MSTFTLSADFTVEVDESGYDDTLTGIAYGILHTEYHGKPVQSQRVRLFDLAEALNTSLRSCLFNDETHSEFLWDTGHSMTMRRASATTVALALPAGTEEMLVEIDEIGALILQLYKSGFSALIAHAVARPH
jgi:hypothetical protein